MKVGLIGYLFAAGWLMSEYRFGFIVRFVFAVVSLAIVGAAFWSLFEIPCSACRKPLGYRGFKVATGAAQRSVPQCPHCEAPLDDAP